ncbi:hypothetical protein PybrP1_007666, partial [[Pythium] brassicae (nom. inval.)]
MDAKPTANVNGAAVPSHLPPTLESASPAGGFVTVRTPVDTRALIGDDDDVDPNGVRLHAWSAPELGAFDARSGYFWSATLCPCFSLAQLETRLGGRRYALALASAALTYALFAASFVGAVVSVVSLPDAGRSRAVALVFWLLSFALFAALIGLRVAALRTRVRERFLIPGSARDDRRVGFLHATRGIRQMAHHLKCDRAVFCSAPSVLHAYE